MIQALVPHCVVALAIVHHSLCCLGVGIVGLALVPWHLFLGDEVVRALKDSLANHFHGMDFLELGDLDGHCGDENELVEDLHCKKGTKSVD